MAAWLAYVWIAVVVASTGGFGYGTAAFLVYAAGLPPGGWWAHLVQAHGHLQVFGWGGMMVLGVGFYFLPRLRGTPLALPRFVPWVLVLMSSGLALRGVFEVIGDLLPGFLPRLALAVSGVLEICAATMAVVVLSATARQGPPLGQRRGLLPVLPYLALGFASLWVALALNAALTLLAPDGGYLAFQALDGQTVLRLGLEGFLVPISVAVAVRSFPLFLWVQVPAPRLLALLFWPLAAGIVLRAVSPGDEGAGPLPAIGSVLEGGSLVAIVLATRVVPLRRRSGMEPSSDPHYIKPVEYLLVPAFAWLAVAGTLQVGNGLAGGLLGQTLLPADVERHALGAGFITLLILGMGQRMLPGFGGREIWSRRLVWWTAALGNGSALLRVALPIAQTLGWTPQADPAWTDAALALSGTLGLLAVLLFGLNLGKTFHWRSS